MIKNTMAPALPK